MQKREFHSPDPEFPFPLKLAFNLHTYAGPEVNAERPGCGAGNRSGDNW